jgi:hypothetical protein
MAIAENQADLMAGTPEAAAKARGRIRTPKTPTARFPRRLHDPGPEARAFL